VELSRDSIWMTHVMTKSFEVEHLVLLHRVTLTSDVILILDMDKRTAMPPNADSHPAPSPVTPRRVPDGSAGGTDGKTRAPVHTVQSWFSIYLGISP
jgi:hypothetical protein